MARPAFTEDEEALIRRIQADDTGAVTLVTEWAVYILLPLGLFAYGLFSDITAMVVVAFLLILWMLCRFVYYQVKPSWRLRPVIDKYEAAFSDEGERVREA